MTETLTYTAEAAADELEVRSEPGDERLVILRIMPWDSVGRTAQGPERFARGAFAGTDPATVTLEAIGPHGSEPGVRLVGRAEWIDERDDGAYAGFRVSRTREGDELLELARDGVYRHASVVFTPVEGGSRVVRGIIERTRVALARVGLVDRPAYMGAGVIAVRSEPVDTETNPPTEPEPVPVPDPEPEPAPASLDAFRREMASRFTALEARGFSPASSSPLGQFRSLDAYAEAVYTGHAAPDLLARVLADQLTTDNPGVMGGFGGEVRGILGGSRPAIEALGGSVPLDDAGMTQDWPVVDPALDWDGLVAKQATEKTDIHSVKVKILTDSSPIETFAGGSDISYQLIRRSRPAYREAYLRIMTIAYGRETEAAFELALAAKGTGSAVLAPGADADALRAFLFAASAIVDQETGAPASVVLASPAAWAHIGGLPGLYPAVYGTSNVAGTAQASTLRINVSGLEIVRAPYLTAGVIVTNGLAARWAEDGPLYAQAEDVAKLGQNNAVWGMGAAAVYVPSGVVVSAAVTRSGSAQSAKEK